MGFSRPKSKWAVLSYAIRAYEHSPFSHTFIRWHSDRMGMDLVYQASHGMAHFVSGERFDADNLTVESFETSLDHIAHRALRKKAMQLAGAKYGRLQLLGMAIERLTGLRNPWRDGEETFVCSELVGDMLKIMGCFSGVKIDLELAGPKALRDAVASLPQFKKLP